MGEEGHRSEAKKASRGRRVVGEKAHQNEAKVEDEHRGEAKEASRGRHGGEEVHQGEAKVEEVHLDEAKEASRGRRVVGEEAHRGEKDSRARQSHPSSHARALL